MEHRRIKLTLVTLVITILVVFPIGVLAQKPSTEMKILIKDDGTVAVKYNVEGEFEANKTKALNLEASANIKFNAKETSGNIVANLNFESTENMQQKYLKFEIELKGEESGEENKYSSKLSGTINVAFSGNEKVDELKIKLEKIETTMDENNVTKIKGIVSIYSSDPMLLMFLMALSKDQINKRLEESNMNYVHIDKMETNVIEKNTAKIDFAITIDMNQFVRNIKNKESREAFWNLIKAFKHKHTLESYISFSLEMNSKGVSSNGSLSFTMNWHYKGNLEALKKLFSKPPSLPKTTHIPPTVKGELSEEDIWELSNATQEFLENVEISFPSEISFSAKANVVNGKGKVSLNIVTPPLKAKKAGGAEGAKIVLKYLGKLLATIDDKLEKIASHEENIKPILEAIIPEKVSLEPYESEKYIVKIEPRETTVDKLGEVNIEIIPKATQTATGSPQKQGTQIPIPSGTTLGILVAIAAIAAIGAALLRKR